MWARSNGGDRETAQEERDLSQFFLNLVERGKNHNKIKRWTFRKVEDFWNGW